MKRTLYEALAVTLVSIFLALIVNGLGPQGIKLYEAESTGSNEPHSRAIQSISITSAIEKYKTVKVLFIDARASNDFYEKHIKGAINLPEAEFDELIDEFILKTDPGINIITYCDGEDCMLANELAEKLYFTGFDHVSYIENGLSSWIEASQPVSGIP